MTIEQWHAVIKNGNRTPLLVYKITTVGRTHEDTNL